MICESCGSENREDAAFCMACGTPLPGTPFSSTRRREPFNKTTEAEPFHPASPIPPTPPLDEEIGGRVHAADRDRPFAARSSRAGESGPDREGKNTEAESGLREVGTGSPPPREASAPVGPARDGDVLGPGPGRVLSPGGFVFGVGGTGARGAGGDDVFRSAETAVSPAPSTEKTGNSVGEAPSEGPVPPAAGETVAWSPGEEGGEVAEEGGGPVYIPPESDLSPGREAEVPGSREAPPPAPAEAPQDRTQAMEPVPAEGRVRIPQVICPECYARNPEMNRFCQECGNPLPAVSGGRPSARRPGPVGSPYPPTAALPPLEDDASGEESVPERGRKEARRERRFGAADALASLGVILLAAALLLPSFLEGFPYKRGGGAGVFSHQGSYVRGTYELLGGPGILPYRGTEFFTVGTVIAAALFLSLLFLALRVGRGPVFLLAGCLAGFLPVYLFFQALLPLRDKGVEIEPALGLARLFFGGDGAPGLGPVIWLVCAAALLLILAGFLAPPRGWGRLFTFLLFFSLALGAGFLCAACYNWNLFISEAAAGIPFR